MKRRTPRSPFVVTVALAVVACGGSTISGNTEGGAGTGAIGGSGGSGGSSGSTGGSSGSAGSGGLAGCPVSPPPDGLPCNLDGRMCTYPTEMPCTGHQCICGTWRTRVGGTGCNPPAPVCPTTLPPNGAACTDESLQCSFPTDPNGCCPPAQATCTCGVWQTTISTCNPPAPPCPVDVPQQGASCVSSDPCAPAVYDCSWGDCGNGVPLATGSCNGQYWAIMPNCVAASDAGSD